MLTFKKEERLYSKKIINRLFSDGKSFIISPFRVVWLEGEPEMKYPAKVLISVSKKKFKRAVDRNLLKRRTREAYRKNKDSFYKFLNRNSKSCVFALLYISGEQNKYKEIEEKIILILQRLQKEYEKDFK